MLMSIATWKHLHDTTKLEWDEIIPPELIKLAILTTYTFFLECHTSMPGYQVSEHPHTQLFLVGMSDAGYHFHAYQLYLVSVLHDYQKQEFNYYCLSQRRIIYMTGQFRITK